MTNPTHSVPVRRRMRRAALALGALVLAGSLSDRVTGIPSTPGAWARSETRGTARVADLTAFAYLPLVLNHAVAAQPPAPTPSPAPSVALKGAWTVYRDTNAVSNIAVDPVTGDLWAVTQAGPVRWDALDETYVGFAEVEGLPGEDARFVAIDPSGNRWFGFGAGRAHEAGVVRIGADGQALSIMAGEGVPFTSNMAALAVGPDGALWVGDRDTDRTDDDPDADTVHRRAPDGAWRTWRIEGCEWPNYGINHVAPDGAGGAFVGVGCGAFQAMADGTVRRLPVDDNDVRAIAIVAQDDVWFGGSRGVHHLRPDGSVDTVPDSDDYPNGQIYAMAFDTAGSLWAVDESTVYVRQPSGAWRQPTLPRGQWLAAGRDGSMWLAGDSLGLFRIASAAGEPRWRMLRTADGPAGTGLTDIAVDGDGNRWFASSARGIGRLSRDGVWSADAGPEGIALDRYGGGDLDVGPDGTVWLADGRNLWHRLPNGDWEELGSMELVGPGFFTEFVALAPDGSAYVGARGGAAVRAPNGAWRALPDEIGSINAIAADAAGNGWFGTNDGLVKVATDGAITRYSGVDRTDFSIVEHVVPGPDGTVWFTTWRDGLWKVRPNGTLAAEPPPSGPSFLPALVEGIALSPGGGLWVSYHGAVAYRWPGQAQDRWSVFTTGRASSSGGNVMPSIGVVRPLAADDTGAMWFGPSDHGDSSVVASFLTDAQP